MKLRNTLLVLSILCLTANFSFANMKKGKVGNGGSKGFAFSNFSDGFCTLSVIYDTSRSQLGAGMALPSGDLVCAGLSSQANFQSCTAGLPAGDYVFVVVSLSGASNFRSVVNCSDQQFLSTAGATAEHGVRINDIDLSSTEHKVANQLKLLLEKASRK